MTLKTWGVREALEVANVRLVDLQNDARDVRLGVEEKAIVAEMLQANNLVLDILRENGTIPVDQRGVRSQQVLDKALAAKAVVNTHKVDMSLNELFAAIDLCSFVSDAIRDGLSTFPNDIAWRWRGESGDGSYP